MTGFETKKWKKVAFKVIDSGYFLTSIWRVSKTISVHLKSIALFMNFHEDL